MTTSSLPSKNPARRILILIAIPIIVVAIAFIYYFLNLRYVGTDDAYIKMGISSISSQINGMIKEVKVKNNALVKKGDVILIIEPLQYQIAVDAAKANLSATVNQIENLKASLRSKVAMLEAAKDDQDYYGKQFARAKNLKAASAGSQADLDAAQRQLNDANQTIITAQEEIKQITASLDGNADLPNEQRSTYLQAKAALDKVSFDLNNTSLVAPFDGYVSNLYSKEGSYATAGIPLFSVIDNKDIWVEAFFKETELTNIKENQNVVIEIDSFPKNPLTGKVHSITKASGSEFSLLPAQNSSGNWVKVTQRIMIRINIDDHKNLPISSGMSALVTIDTKAK